MSLAITTTGLVCVDTHGAAMTTRPPLPPTPRTSVGIGVELTAMSTTNAPRRLTSPRAQFAPTTARRSRESPAAGVEPHATSSIAPGRDQSRPTVVKHRTAGTANAMTTATLAATESCPGARNRVAATAAILLNTIVSAPSATLSSFAPAQSGILVPMAIWVSPASSRRHRARAERLIVHEVAAARTVRLMGLTRLRHQGSEQRSRRLRFAQTGSDTATGNTRRSGPQGTPRVNPSTRSAGIPQVFMFVAPPCS